MCLASLGDIVVPMFIGMVIDAMSLGTPEGDARVNEIIKVWILFLTAGSICTFLNKIIFGYTCELIGTRIRKDLFEKVIRKDVTFFDKVKTGDISKYNSAYFKHLNATIFFCLVSRISSDTQII